MRKYYTQLLMTLMVLATLINLNGCKTTPAHIPNPNAVYYFATVFELPKDTIYFKNEKKELELIRTTFPVSINWRLTGDKR